MPAQEETNSVTVLTWTLNSISDLREFQDAMFALNLVATVWRHPEAPPQQQGRVQVDLPDKRNSPILVEGFGRKVRTVTMDSELVSIELLPEEAA